MLDIDTVRILALSFPEVTEQDHFGRPSFRIKKKIFATLWPKENIAVLKLNDIEQSVFCDFNRTIIYPVEGAWGRKGFTKFEISRIEKDLFLDALKISYCLVAPAALGDLVKN